MLVRVFALVEGSLGHGLQEGRRIWPPASARGSAEANRELLFTRTDTASRSGFQKEKLKLKK